MRHAAPGGQYGGAGGPYGTPYGGYGSPYAPGQPYSPKTSGWAIASFISGLLGGIILSVIFGHIALNRIKRLGQQGRGFAVAGLVLSGIWSCSSSSSSWWRA
jgi:high-affinity Fe2+/Pb2+ permease